MKIQTVNLSNDWIFLSINSVIGQLSPITELPLFFCKHICSKNKKCPSSCLQQPVENTMQSLNHLCGPSLQPLQSSFTGKPSAKQRCRITSLDVLATALALQLPETAGLLCCTAGLWSACSPLGIPTSLPAELSSDWPPCSVH